MSNAQSVGLRELYEYVPPKSPVWLGNMDWYMCNRVSYTQ